MNNFVFPLTVTLAVQVMVSLTAVTIPVLAPVIAGDLRIDPNFVGLFVSFIYVGGMISSLISGDFIIRYGAMRVSQVCLMLCGLGIGLTVIGWLPMTVFCAFLIGFGYGPITPASSHTLVQNCPPQRISLIFSIKQTGVPGGSAIAGVLIPFLLLQTSWREAALIVAGCCFVLTLLVQPAHRLMDAPTRTQYKLNMKKITEPMKTVLGLPRVRSLVIVSFFYSTIQLSFLAYLVTYLHEVLALSLVACGFALTISQIAGVMGRIFWGFVADHSHRPRLVFGALGIMMSIMTMAFASIDLSWSYSSVLLVCGLFGASAIGWNGVYLAELARMAPPGMTGTVTGGGLFFTFLGVVAGPPLFGLIATFAGGFGVAFLVFGGICFFMSIPILLRV